MPRKFRQFTIGSLMILVAASAVVLAFPAISLGLAVFTSIGLVVILTLLIGFFVLICGLLAFLNWIAPVEQVDEGLSKAESIRE